WQGDLVFGPTRDGGPTFQRLDDNPHWQGLPELDDAGTSAVEHYFRAYGPATTDHLQHWIGSGLGVGGKRLLSWIAGLGDRLTPVEIEGERAYILSQDLQGLAAMRPSTVMRLLHQPLCAVGVDRVPGHPIDLEAGTDDRTIGDAEDLRDRLGAHAGIGDDWGIRHGLLGRLQIGHLKRHAGSRPADEDRVEAEERRAACPVRDAARADGTRELRLDVVEEEHRVRADRAPVPGNLADPG